MTVSQMERYLGLETDHYYLGTCCTNIYPKSKSIQHCTKKFSFASITFFLAPNPTLCNIPRLVQPLFLHITEGLKTQHVSDSLPDVDCGPTRFHHGVFGLAYF